MANDGGESVPGTSGISGANNEAANTRKDGLTRLLEKQLDEINAVSKKIELWKTYKKDYEDLRGLIDKLQDKVRHPHRIPIAGTKIAFVDGHIVHTNEFHVLLGYNYFALRSARQASKIVDRRLNDLKQRMKQTEDARKKAEDWMNATIEHKQDKEKFVEIIQVDARAGDKRCLSARLGPLDICSVTSVGTSELN